MKRYMFLILMGCLVLYGALSLAKTQDIAYRGWTGRADVMNGRFAGCHLDSPSPTPDLPGESIRVVSDSLTQFFIEGAFLTTLSGGIGLAISVAFVTALAQLPAPEGFDTLPDGRIRVRVHQLIRDHAGKELSDKIVNHIYAFDGGKIRGMVIEAVG